MSLDSMPPAELTADKTALRTDPTPPPVSPSSLGPRSAPPGPGERKENRFLKRRFTRPGTDPFEGLRFEERDARIQNPDGSVVFEMRASEVPADWSQLA